MQMAEFLDHQNIERIESSSSVRLLLSMQQVSDHTNSTSYSLACLESSSASHIPELLPCHSSSLHRWFSLIQSSARQNGIFDGLGGIIDLPGITYHPIYLEGQSPANWGVVHDISVKSFEVQWQWPTHDCTLLHHELVRQQISPACTSRDVLLTRRLHKFPGLKLDKIDCSELFLNML